MHKVLKAYNETDQSFGQAGGYAVKMISLLNNPSVPGAEYLEVGWK